MHTLSPKPVAPDLSLALRAEAYNSSRQDSYSNAKEGQAFGKKKLTV